jgi:hypothetical protein
LKVLDTQVFFKNWPGRTAANPVCFSAAADSAQSLLQIDFLAAAATRSRPAAGKKFARTAIRRAVGRRALAGVPASEGVGGVAAAVSAAATLCD